MPERAGSRSRRTGEEEKDKKKKSAKSALTE